MAYEYKKLNPKRNASPTSTVHLTLLSPVYIEYHNHYYGNTPSSSRQPSPFSLSNNGGRSSLRAATSTSVPTKWPPLDDTTSSEPEDLKTTSNKKLYALPDGRAEAKKIICKCKVVRKGAADDCR